MKTNLCLTLAVAVLLSCRMAMALSYVELRYSGPGPTQAANLWANSTTFIGDAYTGVYNLDINPAAGSYSGADAEALVGQLPANHIVGTFCSDVFQWAPVTADYQRYYLYDMQDAPVGGPNTPMQAAKADDLRRLFGKYFHAGFTNDDAAAFQACVWEIVFENANNPYDVTSGALHLQETWGSGWTSTANGWLSDLGNTRDNNIMALVSDTYQDYSIVVTALPPPVGSSVPEPLTMLSLILGTSGLSVYVRGRAVALGQSKM